jgi:2'-hydroxyisoflavone reductase
MYGGLKALCERAAGEALPNRTLIVRPGLIVGPHDYTDRFTYWVARIARGGEVLAPGRPGRPVQFIDARDLAEWIVRILERKETGVYNADGLPGTVTMEDVLAECQAASDSGASLTWVTEEYLRQEKVAAWGEMPLWMPEEDAPARKGSMLINCDRALASGLTFRSLRETVRDTLTWYETRANEELKAGMDPEKERRLLMKWRTDNRRRSHPS